MTRDADTAARGLAVATKAAHSGVTQAPNERLPGRHERLTARALGSRRTVRPPTAAPRLLRPCTPVLLSPPTSGDTRGAGVPDLPLIRNISSVALLHSPQAPHSEGGERASFSHVPCFSCRSARLRYKCEARYPLPTAPHRLARHAPLATPSLLQCQSTCCAAGVPMKGRPSCTVGAALGAHPGLLQPSCSSHPVRQPGSTFSPAGPALGPSGGVTRRTTSPAHKTSKPRAIACSPASRGHVARESTRRTIVQRP